MIEELKQAVEDAAPAALEDQEVPTPSATAEVKKPKRARAHKKVEAQMTEEAQVPATPVIETPQVIAPEAAANPTNGHGDLMSEVRGTFKDVAEQVGKSPVTKKVKEVAKEVADEVEKNAMAKKMVERVKTTAEQVDKSELASQVRKAMKDTAGSIEKSPLLAAAHKVLLASIGAVALAQEEIEDFVNRLVERGEIAESDGKKMLKDVLEKRTAVLERTSEYVEHPRKAVDEVERRIEAAMSRMNIPTKEEIEALGAKITALTRKVDELKKTEPPAEPVNETPAA